MHWQAQGMRKELGQLEALWHRPDTSGFAELGANDALNLSSHAWTVSIDPATGALRSAHQHTPPGQTPAAPKPADLLRALRLLSLSMQHWVQRSGNLQSLQGLKSPCICCCSWENAGAL